MQGLLLRNHFGVLHNIGHKNFIPFQRLEKPDTALLADKYRNIFTS